MVVGIDLLCDDEQLGTLRARAVGVHFIYAVVVAFTVVIVVVEALASQFLSRAYKASRRIKITIIHLDSLL